MKKSFKKILVLFIILNIFILNTNNFAFRPSLKPFEYPYEEEPETDIDKDIEYDYCILGDSISDHKRYGKNTNLYMDYIDEITGFTCCNLSNMGSGFVATAYDTDKNSWQALPYYYRITEVPKDVPVTLIFGSFNDLFMNCPVGRLDDVSTFSIYGSANILYNSLKTLNPAMKIGLIIPLPWRAFEITPEYKQKCIQYAIDMKIWAQSKNIPCLDLYNDSYTFGYDLTKAENFIDGDNIHVSLDIHKNYLTPRVSTFLAEIYRMQ